MAVTPNAAQAYYNQGAGEPGTQYISPDDAKAAIAQIYTDLNSEIARVEGLIGSGGPLLPNGGDITEYAGYRAHRFTTNGTFQLPENTTVDFLIVAGGGGGSSGRGGAGGAGGVIQESSVFLTAADYSIVVGVGGVTGSPGSNGANTTAFGRVAVGGGTGGISANGQYTGHPGGSGGGAACNGNNGWHPGGTATAGQGFDGGPHQNNDGSAGGGGAAGVGVEGLSWDGGVGGNGIQSSITGTALWYAAGGGGSGRTNGAAGGSLIGGHGGGASTAASLPIASTGSGGGAGFDAAGSDGANGVVIVRYAY